MRPRRYKLAKSERMKEQCCLKCGEPNDAASGVVDKHARNTIKPRPGDVTLCMNCGHLMMFTNDLSFRELTKEEQKHAATDRRLITTRAALALIIKARTKH